MMSTGRTLTAICMSTVVVGRSTNLFVFWRRSMFESVRRPAARNADVLAPRSFTRLAALSSPVISTQSRPPDGSGWIIPVLMSDDSAWVTTSKIVKGAGETVIPGVQTSRPTTRTAKPIQMKSTLGWNRSGGMFFSCRRGFFVSGSGIKGMV